MKFRNGLHKKISSIFDGSPASRPQSADSAGAIAPETPSGLTNTYGPSPAPVPSASPVSPSSDSRSVDRTRAVSTSRKIRRKDPRQQRMLIIMTVLIPVFVFIMIMAFHSPNTVNAAAKSQASAKAVAAAKKETIEISWQPPAPWPDLPRDPMQINAVSVASQAVVSQLMVKGIVFSQNKPSAIIGDRIVFEGNTVGGALIRKINKDSVEFERDGKTWTQQVCP